VSEQQTQGPTPAAAPSGELRARVERLLTDTLGLMGFPARLDFKDGADGSLSVALHFEAGPPPGVEPGKRSQVVDSLQFLLNKMLHRPGVERRWVVLGAGAHPEPRAPKGAAPVQAQAPAQAQAAQAPAPKAAPAPRPAPQQKAAPAPKPAAPAAPPKRGESDERSTEVAEDAELREAVRQLAEKSGKLGRFYALAAMKLEDRSRVLKAVDGVAGVQVSGVGEGRNRRVVFTPEKPAPLPKRSLLPADDDEDDAEG
jgi:predicted RNA-binding protein Jag